MIQFNFTTDVDITGKCFLIYIFFIKKDVFFIDIYFLEFIKNICRKHLVFQRRDNAIFFHHNGSQEMRATCERQAFLLYYGGKTIQAKAVTANERYRLIMECRASGMTDYQWCIAHNIRPSTFYN